MLGERIREIRKKKKMTLETLAGEELTKGMLSLIENNKANPSMESLTYIARRLGVELTELLEETSTYELRELLDQVEKLYYTDSDSKKAQYGQILSLIEPYISNLTQGYESARLLDLYGRSLFQEKKDGWLPFLEKSAKMYDEMNLTARRSQVGIFRSMVHFVEHEYSKALCILLQERKDIEARHSYLDPMTRVDFDYHEAILHFAVGDSKSATSVMEGAINFSKENRIFYRIDDLYRLAAAYGIITGDEEKKSHYSLKLKQYGEFAEDSLSLMVHDLFHVMTLITVEKEYSKALEIINSYLSTEKLEKTYGAFYYLEKGKALYYLNEFEEAIECLEKVEIPSYIHHPFDLSLLYAKDSYKALCYQGLGDLVRAVNSAKIGAENFESLPYTPYKDFALDTYRKIESKT